MSSSQSSSWQKHDNDPLASTSSTAAVISEKNRRQALEILHHDPLHIDHDEDDGEAVSLLYETNNFQYVDVSYGNSSNNRHHRTRICTGYFRRYMNCRSTAAMITVLLIVVAIALVTQKRIDIHNVSIPHINIHNPHKNNNNNNLKDACLERFNKSIAELIQEVSSYTTDTSDWCHQHAGDDCHCESTIQPSPQTWPSQAKFDFWQKTLERNIQMVQQHTQQVQQQQEEPQNHLDVVLFGDSITEHWLGTELTTRWEQWKGNKQVFDETFPNNNALPLGIAGDKVGQLLYRLENGELPKSLHAKVYWILIGTNDLTMQCSVEAVVAGNIRVVQELQRSKPEATVVLNSILPRGDQGEDDLTDSVMWQNIQSVNEWLQCYAESTMGVEFYDATSLFTKAYNGDIHQIEDYFYDDVHPSEEGSKGWAQAIKQRIDELTTG
ncbi:GDSL family lipolytic protein [Nitzschia inconspicua]|uniref:GDSL family lipolytic protein n=1 Tax=Nitzschia inconspicua TaxID=303405 RepID=A0A9K3PLD1_9STRA|nr:GDSL family lipolytic protein [Nitzschia inconspicua]